MTQVWTLIPRALPSTRHRCEDCDEPFACTGKFRVNAQKRRLDVWLLFRCPTCRAVWRGSVLRRAPPELAARFSGSDPALVEEIAFESSLASSLDLGVPFELQREGEGDVVVLRLPRPLRVRVDRVLAEGLGWSRSRVARAFDRELLRGNANEGLVVTLPEQ